MGSEVESLEASIEINLARVSAGVGDLEDGEEEKGRLCMVNIGETRRVGLNC